MKLSVQEYKKFRRLCREIEKTVTHLRGFTPGFTEDALVHALNDVMPLLEIERDRLVELQRTRIPPEEDNPRRLV